MEPEADLAPGCGWEGDGLHVGRLLEISVYKSLSPGHGRRLTLTHHSYIITHYILIY